MPRGPAHYLCLLAADTNSQAYGCWFYFRATFSGQVRFTLVPFQKSAYLYAQGMHVCVHSNGRWRRGGLHIQYEPFREVEDRQYYSLSFSHDFGRDRNPV